MNTIYFFNYQISGIFQCPDMPLLPLMINNVRNAKT